MYMIIIINKKTDHPLANTSRVSTLAVGSQVNRFEQVGDVTGGGGIHRMIGGRGRHVTKQRVSVAPKWPVYR